MLSGLGQVVVVFVAGFLAGLVNSVAGGGTLLSFPALVWIGRDPIVANVSNAMALWPGSLSAALGYRRQLAESRPWLTALAPASVIGAAVGAGLLLLTPSRTFAGIVPYLILFATLLLASQERLGQRLRRTQPAEAGGPAGGWGAAAFQFCVAVYGGYFGAGMGIMMLAALGLLGLTDIHRRNGTKNALAACINLVAALCFALWGPVRWDDALLLAAGAICGGYAGAGLALRLGRRVVHRTIVFVGLAMAIWLLLRR